MVSLNVNVSSMNAQRLVNINSANLAKTTQRLSSGLRINGASDDPSGLGIAENLTSQIRGDKVASDQNIQQAQSMIQVADSALSQVGDILQRMRELAVAASSDTLTTQQQTALNDEAVALGTALDAIANSASFNGKQLLDGTAGLVVVQNGWQATQTSGVDLGQAYDTNALGVDTVDLTNLANATNSQAVIDTAIQTVVTGRANLGAQSSGLEALKRAKDASIVATTDARSRIQDADVAAEVSNLVRQQLLQQSGASALASANFNSQFLLKLLT
jgi:flagellin